MFPLWVIRHVESRWFFHLTKGKVNLSSNPQKVYLRRDLAEKAFRVNYLDRHFEVVELEAREIEHV